MKAVRAVMTVFLLVIVALVFMGWRWSATLPSPKIEGARTALVLTGLASCVGIGAIWRVKPRNSTE